jgi:hypothetical protein
VRHVPGADPSSHLEFPVSLTLLASIVLLAVLLFVVPALVILRDLREGRPDPSWNQDAKM